MALLRRRFAFVNRAVWDRSNPVIAGMDSLLCLSSWYRFRSDRINQLMLLNMQFWFSC